MKAKKSSRKGKPAAKRAMKDLPARATGDVKGGEARFEMLSKIMANAHEMKKALIGNLPR